MGCDIHVVVETCHYPGGDWEKVEHVFRSSDSWREIIRDSFEHDLKRGQKPRAFHKEGLPLVTYTGNPAIRRNYLLFGWLAGVRRDSIQSLSEPRGIPEDVCEAVRKFNWFGHPESVESHSRTHFYLSELLAIDYEKPVPGSHGKPLRLVVGDFFFKMLRELRGIASDPSLVRVILWFDN